MKLLLTLIIGLLIDHLGTAPIIKSNDSPEGVDIFSQSSVQNSVPQSSMLATKIIQIVQDVKSPINGDFYVKTISDERAFKSNLGVAHRRLDKPIVVPLIPHRDFFEALKKAVDRWKTQKEGDQPLVMKVKEIYIWDYFNSKMEKRYAKVTLEFTDEQNESLGVFTSIVSEKGKYKKYSHEKRLEKAFWNCINQFSRQFKSPKNTPFAKTSNNSEEQSSKYGAVINFLDLKKQDIKFARPALAKVDAPGLFRYEPFNTKKRKTEYYAYMENGDLFIKATNYANSGDYYVRVLEKGRYLFMIDKVNLGAISKDPFKDQDKEMATATVGIVIDTEDGVPHFVTDTYLEKLTQPFPDLADKYLIVDILKNSFQLERVRRLMQEINQRIVQSGSTN